MFKETKKNESKFSNSIVISHLIFIVTLKKANPMQKKIFPYINIKYFVWHFKRSLEIQKNGLCSNEIDNNYNLYTYYRTTSNFPFINPIYIPRIYSKIKNNMQKK